MKLAFLGLGAMGYPMAGHLSRKTSHEVVVYNRSPIKSKQWQDDFSGIALPLSDAVKNSDVIFMCLGRDEDVLAVVESPEFDQSLKSGAIVIDHTTTSYELTQTLKKRFSEKSVDFIDAPVSGGQDGAMKGCLSTMIGGDADTIKAVEPLLATYCKSQTHIGAIGSGQLAKMANQIAIAGVLSGLSEAIKFAEDQQLDTEKLLTAISGGAAQSWQMENRGKTMHQRDFDFGFAIEWLIKDLDYCVAQAKTSDSYLPTTKKVLERYKQLTEKGFGREDTSALIRWYD